ncbi:right-handed parallel beta-helix repeat-containing protein [Candidatus Poribacteria bacterium]|nr:right-handed parallel beta-helix repeat-containing protein [Candidatus Poribacteria bacterium]
MADGTYTGLGNFNLDFGGKAIAVKSQNGAEHTIIDCEHKDKTRGFYFHSGETSEAVVDGFTIRNGKADNGGGIYCYNNSSPTITNNIITANEADNGGGIYCIDSSPGITNNDITGNSVKYGGGIYCYYNSSPTIKNNTITGNSAQYGGGGLECISSSPAIQNNIISGNSTNDPGGGIDCNNSSPTITNNTITANSAAYGGGIYCFSSSPTITNNTIARNSASWYGGGIFCTNYSSPTIVNNTITANSANHHGGGVYCFINSSPIVLNTILWNIGPEEIYLSADYTNIVTISYSDIQGGQAGIITNNNGTVNWLEGNIDKDPLFVDAAGGDYHLSDYSPCIGAGTGDGAPITDIEGKTRGTPPDMGAYENSIDKPLPSDATTPAAIN